MNKIKILQQNHGSLCLRVVVCWPLCSESNPLIFEWIFFSFKIEETYTLTTFVDQKQSLSVLSKSMYDSLVWLAFLDLSKLLKNIMDCRSFSILKILTGYRPYSHSLYHFPCKFPSVPKRKSHKQHWAWNLCVIFINNWKTALQNCLNWHLIRDMVTRPS